MVYSHSGDTEKMVRSMRAGAREYLTGTSPKAMLHDALLRAAARRLEQTAKKTTGKCSVFWGTKGGSGVTTLATNFAIALRLRWIRVALPRPQSSAWRRGCPAGNDSAVHRGGRSQQCAQTGPALHFDVGGAAPVRNRCAGGAGCVQPFSSIDGRTIAGSLTWSEAGTRMS